MVKKNKIFLNRPIILLIMDGWGIYKDYPGNAVSRAKTPNFDKLSSEYPVTVLNTLDPEPILSGGLSGICERAHQTIGHGKFPVVADKKTVSLPKIISQQGLTQLKIAETEKIGHIASLLSGQDVLIPGEDWQLVPSTPASFYRDKPEMSAIAVTKYLLSELDKGEYDFIIANLANCDTVGHTGDFEAAIKAVATVDQCLGRIAKNVINNRGTLLVTADHGNAEYMQEPKSGQINRDHTTNPVPFMVVSQWTIGKTYGWADSADGDLSVINPRGTLLDIAPTILGLYNIPIPQEMAGQNLLKA